MELLIDKTSDAIKKAQDNQLNFFEIYENPNEIKYVNQFLLFIKPEITVKDESIKVSNIIELIFTKLHDFRFEIEKIHLLSSDYLEKHEIIAQHYGVINRLAKYAIENIPDIASEKFSQVFKNDISKCKVLGGFQFLDAYQNFNPISLDILWQNKTNIKLAGGTYCEDIKLDGDIIYLVNGFHPRQLMHFTEPGRSIVVFTISSDLNWSIARNEFIGATNPLNAKHGSIRRTLLDNQLSYGLPEISQGMNGVHLSAGPVEGLVELIRYNSNFENELSIKMIKDFRFGQSLIENFNEEQIEKIISNVDVNYQGRQISIFDLTEEKDSSEAISILQRIF